MRLEPALALLRKNTKVEWTEKHRHVARKLFLEEGWVQKRPFDIGWSDESEYQACHKEEGTAKHRLYHCPEWHDIRRGFQMLSESGSKARTSKEWKWQRGIVAHPLSESQWNRGHFSYEKSGSLRRTRAGAYKQKASTLPLMAPCWVPMGHGEHVVGRWCSWTMMGRWDCCMGCMPRWRHNTRLSAPSRVRS